MSKGLEALRRIETQFNELGIKHNESGCHIQEEVYFTIEQELKDYYALKKECEEAKWYQEHKALKIIRENDVDIIALKISVSLEQYNCKEDGRCPLIQDEYDLLKEVLL